MKIVSCFFTPDFPVPERFLSGMDIFFDIETTGLNWRRSHLYLIGAAIYHPESKIWELIQWFADEPARELDLLDAFAEFLVPFQRIIHYNGAGFDLPYLQKKYEFYRREVPFCEMDTLDLYRKFRPFQKLFGLPSMKQKSLEAFAGFSREDTFSGGDLIYAYEEYLASANPALLKTLYLHNKEDVLGMVQILSLYGLADLFSGNFTISGITLSPPSLILSLSLEVPVFLPFTRKSDVFSVTADQKLARLEIQGQQRELKFFFPNYKDYYYLPLEDTAIHKSVGAYVDAEHREKAKASNCYQRHQSLFFPQPSEIISPVFREEYKAKECFFEWKDSLSEEKDLLSQYAAAVLSHLGHL